MRKGTKHTPETILKLREASSSFVPPNQTGKHWTLSEESRENIRQARLGKGLSKEAKLKISLSLKGRSVWHKGKKGVYSEVALRRMSEAKLGSKASLATRMMRSAAFRGSKNHQWIDGRTPVNKMIRRSIHYRLWREAVFARDNFTCIWCGDDRGGNLNADHIKPFSLYPELRFAIDNGRTLCVPCHKKTETFGKKILNIAIT